MGFRIGYTQLLTLRCWHPDFLGAVAGQVPVTPPAAGLTDQAREDYLAYDVRRLLDIRPTPVGRALLRRYGLRWVPSTQGGWLVVRDTFSVSDPAVRLQLGVYLRSPGFAAATNFGTGSLEGRRFHLTNATAAPATQLNLTTGNLRDVHFFPSRGWQVTLPQLTPGTDGQVLLRDPLLAGNPVLRTLDLAGGPAGTDTYSFPIDGLPAGFYRFTGTNIDNVNLLLGFTEDPALLGVISLRLADWNGAAYDLHFQSANP